MDIRDGDVSEFTSASVAVSASPSDIPIAVATRLSAVIFLTALTACTTVARPVTLLSYV